MNRTALVFAVLEGKTQADIRRIADRFHADPDADRRLSHESGPCDGHYLRTSAGSYLRIPWLRASKRIGHRISARQRSGVLSPRFCRSIHALTVLREEGSADDVP
jgi:hypothetical protein